MKLRIVFLLLFGLSLFAVSQDVSHFQRKEQYINKFKQYAIDEMKSHGVPASITLAQALVETDAGKSDLAVTANNHFGIKCHKEWNGDTYHKDDDAKGECFRKYNSALESYRDHSLFLSTRDRYKQLFTLKITDYKGWAYGLKSSGYATNPIYAEKLIKLIEEHNLTRFDDPTWAGDPVKQTGIVSTTADTSYAVLEQPEQFKLLEYGPDERPVYVCNGSKYIYYDKSDTPARIAQTYDLYSWQLAEFNDLPEDTKFVPGEIIYLEKKARKGSEDFYTVKPGETMHSVSQKLGIRLKKLYYRNRMNEGTNPPTGTTLWLRKRKPKNK